MLLEDNADLVELPVIHQHPHFEFHDALLHYTPCHGHSFQMQSWKHLRSWMSLVWLFKQMVAARIQLTMTHAFPHMPLSLTCLLLMNIASMQLRVFWYWAKSQIFCRRSWLEELKVNTVYIEQNSLQLFCSLRSLKTFLSTLTVPLQLLW